MTQPIITMQNGFACYSICVVVYTHVDIKTHYNNAERLFCYSICVVAYTQVEIKTYMKNWLLLISPFNDNYNIILKKVNPLSTYIREAIQYQIIKTQ